MRDGLFLLLLLAFVFGFGNKLYAKEFITDDNQFALTFPEGSKKDSSKKELNEVLRMWAPVHRLTIVKVPALNKSAKELAEADSNKYPAKNIREKGNKKMATLEMTYYYHVSTFFTRIVYFAVRYNTAYKFELMCFTTAWGQCSHPMNKIMESIRVLK